MSATTPEPTATATDATATASPATVTAITRATGRKSRATRSAETARATATVAGATGRTTTGDNGVKTASQVRRELAAQPVRIKTASSARKTATGDPTATDVKRLVASALVKAGADLAVNWDKIIGKTGKTDPLRKVDAETAMILINKYLSYVGTCTWDPRLPAREHPGGRGKTA